MFMEIATAGISNKNLYAKINLRCSHLCTHDLVFYECLFTNKEINSSTVATTKNNGKHATQTCATPAAAAAKNIRNPRATATATAPEEEMDYLKIMSVEEVYFAPKALKGKVF
jgi:hypothetical protein